MKILIINTRPFDQNGMTSVIVNYYAYMDRAGMQIDVVAQKEPPAEIRLLFERNGSRVFVMDRYANTPLYVHNLMVLMRREKYDLVHVHGNSALMTFELNAAALAGVKRRAAHSHNTQCKYRKAHRLLWPMFDRLVNIRLSCGEEAGRWLYRKEPFYVLRNCVPAARFAFSEEKRTAIRAELGIGDVPVIGHVGRFNTQKNHAFFLKLLPLLPEDVRLLLVGDGDLYESFMQDAASLGLTDRIISIRATVEPERYYPAMDVFTLPSKFEGFPVAAVEAQANGLPCLFSESVTRECALSGDVRFVSCEDPAAWAETILQMLPEGRASDAIVELSKAGYIAETNAVTLRRIYMGEEV